MILVILLAMAPTMLLFQSVVPPLAGGARGAQAAMCRATPPRCRDFPRWPCSARTASSRRRLPGTPTGRGVRACWRAAGRRLRRAPHGEVGQRWGGG